jgi:nucleoside-diphosphate-sugar epimerase
MSDLLKGVIGGEEIQIKPGNFFRDFINPADLLNLIICCYERNFKGALDAYSLNYVSKQEVLELFKDKYGLKYALGEGWTSATGDKYKYYSVHKIAENLGFMPKFTSLRTIEIETDIFLRERNK